MAKRGRRSIRNKRKSVKKYSSKCRSKTRRYLRGGVLSNREHDILPDAEKDRRLGILQRAHQEKIDNMTSKEREAYYRMLDEEEYDSDGGGRRRYYRRKQSKSRSRKH